MSHPVYNPFASGNQSSTQGQYGPPLRQMERDPRRANPHQGPGSSFGSSATSSGNPAPSTGPVPSLLSLPIFRPERSRMKVDEDIERCLDLTISRAREEVRHSTGMFPGNQMNEFSAVETVAPQFRKPPAPCGLGPSNLSSGSTSLDWLSVCRMGTDDSSKVYPSIPSTFPNSGNGRFNTAKGNCDVQSIPGLGDYDNPGPEKPVQPMESTRPKYTSESASSILLHFGLEKDDLEHLISYPEDQITPENLPFILRQIREEKDKRGPPYNEPRPISNLGTTNKITSSGMVPVNQEEISSIVLKPSKVIDYGHTGKYTATIGGETGRPSSHTRELLPKSKTEFKSSSMASSKDQTSATSFGSLRSPGAPLSADPAKRMQGQPNKMSQLGFSSNAMPNKDTDIRHLQSEVPKSLPLKQAKQDCPTESKPQPSCTLYRGVHPDRPGLVLIGSTDQILEGKPSRAPGQAPKPPAQVKQQQQQQHMKQQQKQQTPQHQVQPQPKKTPQGQALPQQRQPSKEKQGPVVLRVLGVKKTAPKHLISASTAPSTPISPIVNVPQMQVGTSKKQLPQRVAETKSLPVQAMMQDYAAATPRKFPHTCCLCNKDSSSIKDWLFHQNTNVHLENCRLLRTRYPDWDGTTTEIPSSLTKDGKHLRPQSPPHSRFRKPDKDGDARSLSPPHHAAETRRGKRSSRSRSPRPHYGSEDRRQKRSSRSRSPRSYYGSDDRREKRSSRSRSPRHRYGSADRKPKHSSRSQSRSPRRSYGSIDRREKHSGRSQSPSRYYAFDSRRDRRSRSQSPHESRYSRRSSSPRYDRHHRSRSRSYERYSPTRRREKSRSYERRSPPRRTDEKRSSPRSRDRRSADESSSQQKSAGTAEKLAKRLLETSAVQALSKQSNLEAMVKSLAPALLAELAKMKSVPSGSSSSSSSAAKKTSVAKSTKAKPAPKKNDTSAQSKSSKVSVLGKVRLGGVSNDLSHSDVAGAMESYGKIKSVVLFRSTKQAIVSFEKEEDAEKLRSSKSLQLKGVEICIDKEVEPVSKKPAATKEQKVPEKSTESGVSAPKTNKSTSSGNVKTPSASSLSEATTTTTGKVVKKTKVVVSKGKNVPTKAGTKVQKATSVDPKPKTPAKKQGPDAPKQEATDAVSVKKSEKSELPPKECKSQSSGTLSKPVKEDTVLSKETRLTSEPERHANMQKLKNESQSSAVKSENVEESKDPAKSSENKLLVKKTEVEKSALEPKETDKVPESQMTSDEKNKCVSDDTKPPEAQGVQPPQNEEAATQSIEVESSELKNSTPIDKDALKTETEDMSVMDSLKEQEQNQEKMIEIQDEMTLTEVKTEQDQTPKPEATSAAPADPKCQAVTDLTVTCVSSLGEEIKSQQEEERSSVKMDDVNSQMCVPPNFLDNEDEPKADTIPPKMDTDIKKDEKPEPDAIAKVSDHSEASDAAPENKSPRAPLSPGKQAAPAASASTVSAIHLEKSEHNIEEVPKIDENIFNAITTALRKHRMAKESITKSKDKPTANSSKENLTCEKKSKEQTNEPEPVINEDVSSHFEELNFNFEDFVTVDEISGEMEESAVEDVDSSPEVPSGSSHTSVSSKLKSEDPSTTANGSNRSSEPTKSQTKPLHSGRGSKSSSSECFPISASPDQKTQSTKKKAAARKSNLWPKDPSAQSLTAAPVEKSVEPMSPDKKEGTLTESAVEASVHNVSLDNINVKSVESETKPEASSEMDSHLQGKDVKAAEHIQRMDTDFKDGTPKEVRSNEMENKDCISKEDNKDKKYQVIDSYEDQPKEMDKENQQEGNVDTQTSHQKGDPAFDDKGCEMEIDSSKVQTSADETKDCNVRHVSDNKKTELGNKCEPQQANKTKGPDESASKTTKSIGDETKGKQEEVIPVKLSGTVTEAPQASEEQTVTTNDSRNGSDQTKAECEILKLKPPSELVPEMDTDPTEDDIFQVIDSIEDQAAMEAESGTDPEAQALKEHGAPASESCPSSRSSKMEGNEKSPRKQDKTAKKYETRTSDGKPAHEVETDEGTAKLVHNVVEQNSGKDTKTTGRPVRKRTTRSNPGVSGNNPEGDDVFKVLDSVEDEPATDKQSVTRSTRRSKERATKMMVDEEKTKKDVTPTRRRRTLARDSQEKDAAALPGPTQSEEDVTYQIVDAVEEEAVEQDQAAIPKAKRGRPKKSAKTSKKQTAMSKKSVSPSKEMEEEATYCILDAVEDETVDDQSTTDQMEKSAKMQTSSKVDEEEEPVFEIVDSLEEDQIPEELLTEAPETEVKGDTTTVVASSSEEPSCQVLKEIKEDPPAENFLKKDILTEEGVEKESSSEPPKNNEKPHKKNEGKNPLVNLDEVSEDEEEYPDDTAEREELQKKQAVAKKRDEERRSRSREPEDRRRGGTPKKKDEEKLDPYELVTLDEVGGDEGGADSAMWGCYIPEADLQDLVMLDELVEEEEEEEGGKQERVIPETQDIQTADSIKTETSGSEEAQKSDDKKAEKDKISTKRKLVETEESDSFVIVDKVGDIEEEEMEAPTSITRGRAKKKSRQTPVRKSTRGKAVSEELHKDDDSQPPASVDAPEASAALPGDVQKPEVEPAPPPDPAQAEQLPESESPEGKKRDVCSEKDEKKPETSKENTKVVDKRKMELMGPEAKRSRSQSPSVTIDVKLPPFDPKNPLGQEFVVPKSGFFCNLCSMFYLKESTAKDSHCRSQKHYDNLLNHYQKIKQKRKPQPSLQEYFSE